jgi:hypothetical protein
MNSQDTGCRWIIEWCDDSGDESHDFRETADSAEEASEALQRILALTTWTPEDAEEIGGQLTVPSFPILVRDTFHGDILKGLVAMQSERISFRCDDGTLKIEREL